jgi:hypothetical protein
VLDAATTELYAHARLFVNVVQWNRDFKRFVRLNAEKVSVHWIILCRVTLQRLENGFFFLAIVSNFENSGVKRFGLEVLLEILSE